MDLTATHGRHIYRYMKKIFRPQQGLEIFFTGLPGTYCGVIETMARPYGKHQKTQKEEKNPSSQNR
ncbi:hypothetical protein BSR42_02780 [Megasphaera cerevisiae]|nr:hypothetical protein BSR42_02780 [Megasphaera cerevisiae]